MFDKSNQIEVSILNALFSKFYTIIITFSVIYYIRSSILVVSNVISVSMTVFPSSSVGSSMGPSVGSSVGTIILKLVTSISLSTLVSDLSFNPIDISIYPCVDTVIV